MLNIFVKLHSAIDVKYYSDSWGNHLRERRQTRGNDVVRIWTNNGLIDVSENDPI